jgi:hypothetical protein
VPVGSALLTLTFAVRASFYCTEKDPDAVLRLRATADQADGTDAENTEGAGSKATASKAP